MSHPVPGGALRVGPESAGADPGPACYGNGGERATVTDADVVLGYLDADTALGGELSLDVDAAYDVLSALAADADLPDAEAAARGVYRVANATMTRAIRSVTVERGHDPRKFGLVAFGGAGPMHAAALADRLDISRVVVPGPAGVLSAYGLVATDESHDVTRTVRLELDGASSDDGRDAYEVLEDRVLEDVSDPSSARIKRAADCRYVGQSFELTVPVDRFDPERLADRFGDAHERAYGYRLDAPVEAVNIRVTATIDTDSPSVTQAGSGGAVRGTRDALFPDAGWVDATIYDWDSIAAGTDVPGPAILEQAESTTVVPPDWRGRIRPDGALLLENTAGTEGQR